MSSDPDLNDPAGYSSRAALTVLDAVVGVGAVDGGVERMVELRTAVTDTCGAIAMLIAASGEDRTPKDRRDTADLCRRRILTAANGIAQKLAAGEELPWTMQPLGGLH